MMDYPSVAGCGAAMLELIGPKKAAATKGLHVNPELDPSDPEYGLPFADRIFEADDAQFDELKAFCAKENVSQRTLKVRLPELGQLEGRQYDTAVNRELASLLDSFIYRRALPGLQDPFSPTDVSFTRLVLCAHAFCTQAMTDVIFDFFAACRSNHGLNLNAFVYGFNFQQVVLLLTTALEPSFGVRHVLRSCCFVDEEDKLLIQTLVPLCLKYPVLGHPLYTLAHKRMRKAYGFCKAKTAEPKLSLQCDAFKFKGAETGELLSREEALAETAVTIVSDALQLRLRLGAAPPQYVLSVERPRRATSISEQSWVHLKQVFGYRTARDLVEESRLQCSLAFFRSVDEVAVVDDVEQRICDPKTGRDFVYNAASGRRGWVVALRDREYGDVVRESWDVCAPDYVEESEYKAMMLAKATRMSSKGSVYRASVKRN